MAKFQIANTSLSGREEKVQACFKMLEQDLHLLGATAIEDRLQDHVPETIKLLRSAGIRFWMLTGDKRATAIQIATSCNFIVESHLIQLELKPDEPFVAIKTLIDNHYHDAINKLHISSSHDAASMQSSTNGKTPQLAVVVDGTSLRRILEDHNCAKSFVELGLISHAVICCRVTPHQKSEIVGLVRGRGYNTLAIGDGGNDVSMIQRAHVGIGIKGREGLQAARAADYSVAKFHYLGRLIMVHGRYAYKRTAFISLYCFYKSIYLAMVQAAYEYYCGFSGTSLLNTFSLSTYNILFTGLPILFYALDKDIGEDMISRFPLAYQETVSGKSFSRMRFLSWCVRSIFQAGITLRFGMAIFPDDWEGGSGLPMGETNQALLIFSSAILIQTGTVFLQSNSLTWINQWFIFGTAAFYFFFMYLVSLSPAFGMFGSASEFFRQPGYWFGMILITVTAMLPFFVYKYYHFNYTPDVSESM